MSDSKVLTISVYLALIIQAFSDLSQLSFGGIGSRSTKNNNYKYVFSAAFQDQICKTSRQQNCWGAQGVSKSGNYITRSLYPKCYGPDSQYAALSIMKRDSFKYSNILLEIGEKCHAGDHVITRIDGIYYFLIACTKFVAIFNETRIESDKRTVNGKTFYYIVQRENIIRRSHSGVSFSYISRNHEHITQYFCGAFSTEPSTGKLNLKLIEMDKDNNWNIDVVSSYYVFNAPNKVQGATRVGDYMYLVSNQAIRKCMMIKPDGIYNCQEQCKFRLRCWTGGGGNLILEGAETDSNGDLYIGSEFGGGWFCDKAPWFEINKVSDDTSGHCY